MRRILACLCLFFLLAAAGTMIVSATADEISARARKLHFSSIVLDTHDDTTQRFFSKDFDIAKRNADGSIDIPRMREGGLNATFYSIRLDVRTIGLAALQDALY